MSEATALHRSRVSTEPQKTPEIKLSEAGAIPNNWITVPLAKLVDPNSPICYGVVQVGQNTDNGVPIVAIKYVKSISTAPLHRTAANLEKPYSRSRPRGGDVLISIKGTIGRVGIVPAGFNGNISRELARIRVHDKISSEFVAHQLEAASTQERIVRSIVGTTRLEFSIAALRQFVLALPPSLIEQKAVARALSDADALIASLEQLITKKRAIKQGSMQELLSGRRRLVVSSAKRRNTPIGLLPEDWEVEQISAVAEITTGGKNTQDRVEDGAFPFFVRSQEVERINSYSFDGEAVLTAGDGVGTGKVFHYINGKFDAHQRVYRIAHFANRLSGYFFFLFFSNHFYDRIMQMTAKSSVDSVRLEMIAGMFVPVPRSREEQDAIASCIRDMDDEVRSLEAKLTKARAVKQGMMQELLTGRVRLV